MHWLLAKFDAWYRWANLWHGGLFVLIGLVTMLVVSPRIAPWGVFDTLDTVFTIAFVIGGCALKFGMWTSLFACHKTLEVWLR